MSSARTLTAILAAFAGYAVHASHDESVGARFVLAGGLDSGNCLDHHAPCVSVQYALAQAEPGNTVKVGAGIFDLTGVDPETFLHGRVHAQGGYDNLDHYTESRPLQVRSIVVGVDPRYRHTLAVRGFHWAESLDAARRNVVSFDGPALQATAALPSACVQGFASQFPCRNLDLQAQIPLNGFSSLPVSAANVWGFVDRNDSREYAVLGLRNGTAIVDVTDPTNPDEVVTIPGNASSWREVKVYQVFDAVANRWRAYAYVSTEAANSGVQVIDMSGLPSTAALASTNMDTSSQHTLYVSNIEYAGNTALPGATPFLYVAGSNSSGGSWRAYSLANPAAPVIAGTAQTTRYMHDSTGLRITDARTAQCGVGHNPCDLLIDFNVDQVEIWDTTDKLAPLLLGTATNPGNRYIHSGWPNDAGTHVFFHDELEEIQLGLPTRIYTLNLASLRTPTVNVSYTGSTTTTDHNGYVRGNFYYVSHYRRGVVVFDASNPSNLVEVAHFDNYLTPNSNSAGTDGTWGVYPFLPSGNILVSDIENGLFILRDHARTFGQNAGRIGFSTTAANHGENVGTISLRVQRVVGNAGAVSVQYATSNGTADSGDYTGGNGTLSWAANDIEDKVVAIPVIDDGTVEGAETLNVTLSSPTGGATIDGSSILVITLADNDTAQGGGSGGGGGGGGSTDPALLLLAALALLAQRRRALRHE